MSKSKINNRIMSISIERLMAHPDSPNRMGKSKLAKLNRNIKRTGLYEPLVARPYSGRRDFFQIINGHHRYQVLCELDYETVDVIIWDIDDQEVDILLASINRLCGSDNLEKKLSVLNRLNQQIKPTELTTLLPLSKKQIERLLEFGNLRLPSPDPVKAKIAIPLVFFVNNKQKKLIDKALSLAGKKSNGKTKAEKNAIALSIIADYFSEESQ